MLDRILAVALAALSPSLENLPPSTCTNEPLTIMYDGEVRTNPLVADPMVFTEIGGFRITIGRADVLDILNERADETNAIVRSAASSLLRRFQALPSTELPVHILSVRPDLTDLQGKKMQEAVDEIHEGIVLFAYALKKSKASVEKLVTRTTLDSLRMQVYETSEVHGIRFLSGSVSVYDNCYVYP